MKATNTKSSDQCSAYLEMTLFVAGNLWPKPWLQSTAHRHYTHGSLKRPAGTAEKTYVCCCKLLRWDGQNSSFIRLQSMAEQLAENYHNTWGRKKKLELQAKGELGFLRGCSENKNMNCFPEVWQHFYSYRRWNSSSAGALWHSDGKGKGTR